MREEGYDFYDIKVLDVAFKQGDVKLINYVVRNSLIEQVQNNDDTTNMLEETWFNESDFAK